MEEEEVEEDLRSIHAENVGGDDDELDANLERQFQAALLAQHERASTGARSAEGERSKGVESRFNFGRRSSPPSGAVGEVPFVDCRLQLALCHGEDDCSEELERRSVPRRGWLEAGGRAQALDFDAAFERPREDVSSGRDTGVKSRHSTVLSSQQVQRVGRGLGELRGKIVTAQAHCDVEIGLRTRNLSEEGRTQSPERQFHFQNEETTCLGLSSSHYSRGSGFGEKSAHESVTGNRRLGSVSRSNASVATSLERQYSTGSTSTVESPHVVPERRGNEGPRRVREPHLSLGPPGLTFSFPGWGVDMSKGVKQKNPSITRHHELCTQPAKRTRASGEFPGSEDSFRGKGAEEDLGDTSPVGEMPDEIIFHVMKRLDLKDLCSSLQTCKRWYAVGVQDNLWEHFLEGVSDSGLLGSDSSPNVLPRWVFKKNLSMSANVRHRFHVFRKGYDYLRRALNEWYDNGLQNSRHPSTVMYSLIRKLTGHDWILLYEAFGVAFMGRADCIANMMLRKVKEAGCLTEDNKAHGVLDDNKDGTIAISSLTPWCEDPQSTYSLAVSSSDFEVHWKSGSVKQVSPNEAVIGKELWELLHKSWKRYKGWLHLISTHCPDLNHEVMVERARSVNWSSTPSLYNKGVICFRSQVVLRYGLRSVLQAAFMWLTTQDARGCASDADMDLLRSAHHLLQELDVSDDFTLPLKSHTQTKLTQCFRSALATKSKLELHRK